MSKSEHEAKAREFLDRILKLNKQHGVSEKPAVIKYDSAVKAAAKTPKRLQKSRTAPISTAGAESGPGG